MMESVAMARALLFATDSSGVQGYLIRQRREILKVDLLSLIDQFPDIARFVVVNLDLAIEMLDKLRNRFLHQLGCTELYRIKRIAFLNGGDPLL